MKRLLALLLLTACGTATVPGIELGGSGALPTGPRLAVEPPAKPGLTWGNLRADGDLLAIDVTATESLSGVYGIALRLKLEGATFERAEAAESWDIFRAAHGALVFSAQGTAMERTVNGRLATVWLRPSAELGRIDVDALRSAVIGADGKRRPDVGFGAVRFAR
mgnify:CR=1 FL=1